MNDDKKHCRLINVQNQAPKPKSKKRQNETVDSSSNESDKRNEFAEPDACRKQNVFRHVRNHEKMKFSLEDMKKNLKKAVK